jgi:uncharacterized protein
MFKINSTKLTKNMKKTITWFEIPVKDFERALKFYQEITGIELEVKTMGGNPYGILPNSHEGVGGAITLWPGFEPSEHGVLIYLNANNNIEQVLEKVEKSGGKISTPKAFINEEYGYFATIIDTEGNKIGLHSLK